MIEKIKIDDLTPYSKNAKKHPKKQIQQIADSIDEFGFNQPLVVDKNNVIVVGHGRYEAAKVLGMDEVPVLRRDDLSDEQVRAYRLADNKLNESDWDDELVLEELKELSEEMIELTGFNKDLVREVEDDDFDAKEEYVSAAEEGTDTEVGDIYIMGDHRLICGDSTDPDVIEKVLDGDKIQSVFTDPPYNVGYDYDWRSAIRKGKKVTHNFFDDEKSDEDYFQFLVDVFKNAYKFSKDDASFYCWYADKFHSLVASAIKEAGYYISQRLIWLKNYPVFSPGQDFHRTFEPCLYGWKKGEKRYSNKELATLRSVINWDDFDLLLDLWYQERDNIQEYEHPTQKPVELAERALKKSTQAERERDVVFDFFVGSGSTLIACEQLNRRFRGCELDPIYCDVIVKRWERLTGNKAKKV